MDISIEADRNRKILENNTEGNGGATGGKPSEATIQAQENARNELKVIEGEREDLDSKRHDTIKELEQVKVSTH